MRKIDFNEAKELYGKGKNVYLLFKNGSQVKLQGDYTIHIHNKQGGEFGIKE